ncbi:MAG: DUF4390 domain-containing protein [Acidobacteriota bacterium]
MPLVRDTMVLVSVEQPGGLDAQVRDAIQSGLKITFAYNVDLRLEVPAWIDRTVASSLVSHTVEYDSLTRRYTVVRMIDGRTEEAIVTGDFELVRKLALGLDKLPLFPTRLLEPQREYYVRVRADARPRGGAFLWPWGGGQSGQAKFTFLP